MSINIKEYRNKSGLSQTQFADYFNIPVSTLRKWEQGESRPAPYIIKMIAMLLPSAKDIMKKIITKDGTTYFYEESSGILYDSVGNSIQVKFDIENVKPENLPLYVADLFESFYEIKEKFEQDCRWDKDENIIWS